MRVCLVCVFVFGLVFVLLAVVVCFLFVLVVLLQWDSDCCGLCTGPLPVHLLRPHYGRALCTNSILCSLRHATERVERPGESQLALDGKKRFCVRFVLCLFWPCCFFLFTIES